VEQQALLGNVLNDLKSTQKCIHYFRLDSVGDIAHDLIPSAAQEYDEQKLRLIPHCLLLLLPPKLQCFAASLAGLRCADGFTYPKQKYRFPGIFLQIYQLQKLFPFFF